MPIDPVENLSHSFETRLRVCVHKKSFSVFRKQASERMHTRRGGACRAGEKRSSFQQARSTLPYSLSRPLAYLLPIFWPAAQSSSAMHACVYREESCLSFRLLVLLSGLPAYSIFLRLYLLFFFFFFFLSLPVPW